MGALRGATESAVEQVIRENATIVCAAIVATTTQAANPWPVEVAGEATVTVVEATAAVTEAAAVVEVEVEGGAAGAGTVALRRKIEDTFPPPAGTGRSEEEEEEVVVVVTAVVGALLAGQGVGEMGAPSGSPLPPPDGIATRRRWTEATPPGSTGNRLDRKATTPTERATTATAGEEGEEVEEEGLGGATAGPRLRLSRPGRASAAAPIGGDRRCLPRGRGRL